MARRDISTSFLPYSVLLSLVGDGRCFSDLRVRTVSVHYSALDDQAWQVLKLAKGR